MALLLVDIGNTRTSVAVSTGSRVSLLKPVLTHPPRRATATREVIASYRSKRKISRAVLCSVVPVATRTWERQLRSAGIPAITVTHRTELGVGISYPNAETIGPDRLANACAGFAAHGAPLIVADFGTALTFDIVDRTATYVGGVIAPGLPLMTDYLAEKTALLPHISLKGRCARVGRSTAGAMRVGARIGYRGIVREIISHLTEDSDLVGATLCATGGYASWALRGAGMPFHFDPLLTLRGLARIADLNTQE